MHSIRTDLAIIGGGIGACAAALAAAQLGLKVVLTEETQWIGGQFTSQLVPPDEHLWIEQFGANASYRRLRQGIRDYYRSHLPLSPSARNSDELNPGNGWVSKLCHDPRIGLRVLLQMLAPFELNGQLHVINKSVPVAAQTNGNNVASVRMKNLEGGQEYDIDAHYFIDGTPLGDLLSMAGVEYVLGQESRSETGEPHASEDPDPSGQQAITVCFAIEYRAHENHTIDRPENYVFWRDYVPPGWPDRLFSWTTIRPETLEPLNRGLFESDDSKPWWSFRRILDYKNFEDGYAPSDVTIVNWPQNDYWLEPACPTREAKVSHAFAGARGLSLSFLYWLQTEAPRPDGGMGYPGVCLRPDVAGGTCDGLAQAAYIREARRIVAERIVTENDIAYSARPQGPTTFDDSVGVGCYRIDLHPRANGAGYVDVASWPFQIPLGALIPVRVENLLPGGKNLGVTHVANGAFRVHPVEWSIGEATGGLVAFCIRRGVSPRSVRNKAKLLREFQKTLHDIGVETAWRSLLPM